MFTSDFVICTSKFATLPKDGPLKNDSNSVPNCDGLRNSSPANLAEKHSDRHVKNKIEGVNRSGGEALETIHHLYIALRKGYVTQETFDRLRDTNHECVRMLNGLERTLERQLDDDQRRFRSEPKTPEST